MGNPLSVLRYSLEMVINRWEIPSQSSGTVYILVINRWEIPSQSSGMVYILRAGFRIFIQGGRNGSPRNVGGADGYPCVFGTRQVGGSGGMPPQEIFAILSIQRSLLVSFRGGLFYLFCI